MPGDEVPDGGDLVADADRLQRLDGLRAGVDRGADLAQGRRSLRKPPPRSRRSSAHSRRRARRARRRQSLSCSLIALVSPRSDPAPILSARSFKHTRILRGVGTSMTPDVRHAFHIPGCALSARADPRQRSNLGLFCPPAPNRSKWRRSGRYRLQDAVRGPRSSLCSSYGQALRRFTCWLNALAKLDNGGGKLRRRVEQRVRNIRTECP